MELSITKAMDKDHKIIKEILIDFRKEENKNFEKSKHIFSRFKWVLEKHFFIEEKVIFNSFRINSLKENEDLMNILKEHKIILNIIEKSEEILFDQNRLEIEELSSLLTNHSRFEDEVFYPRLDELLTNEQKHEIIERIKEIIIN